MNAPANINAMRSLAVSATGDPFDLAVLVLPGFSHLALHAYIEPFRIANTVSRRLLFRWRRDRWQPVAGASGLSIAVDASMEEFSNGIDDRKTSQLAIVAGEPVER